MEQSYYWDDQTGAHWQIQDVIVPEPGRPEREKTSRATHRLFRGDNGTDLLYAFGPGEPRLRLNPLVANQFRKSLPLS